MGNFTEELKKPGPLGLPMGVWVGVGTVALYLAYRYYKNNLASSSSSANAAPTDLTAGGATGASTANQSPVPSAPTPIDYSIPSITVVEPSTTTTPAPVPAKTPAPPTPVKSKIPTPAPNVTPRKVDVAPGQPGGPPKPGVHVPAKPGSTKTPVSTKAKVEPTQPAESVSQMKQEEALASLRAKGHARVTPTDHKQGTTPTRKKALTSTGAKNNHAPKVKKKVRSKTKAEVTKGIGKPVHPKPVQRAKGPVPVVKGGHLLKVRPAPIHSPGTPVHSKTPLRKSPRKRAA